MANPEPIVPNLPRRDEAESGGSRETTDPPAPGHDDSIKRSLERIFKGLIEVKVITIVQNVELEMKDDDGRTVPTLKPFKDDVRALITIFNLIDGDVVNVIAPELQNNAELRAFHSAQVDKSVAVLPANIAALVKLGKAIIDEF